MTYKSIISQSLGENLDHLNQFAAAASNTVTVSQVFLSVIGTKYSLKQIIPYGNLDLQRGMKSTKNGKYVS